MTQLETWLWRFKTVVHFAPQTSRQMKMTLRYFQVSPNVEVFLVRTDQFCIDFWGDGRYPIWDMTCPNDDNLSNTLGKRYFEELLYKVKPSRNRPALINLSSAPEWFISRIPPTAQLRYNDSAIHFVEFDANGSLIIRNSQGKRITLAKVKTKESTPKINSSAQTRTHKSKTEQHQASAKTKTTQSQPKTSNASESKTDAKTKTAQPQPNAAKTQQTKTTAKAKTTQPQPSVAKTQQTKTAPKTKVTQAQPSTTKAQQSKTAAKAKATQDQPKATKAQQTKTAPKAKATQTQPSTAKAQQTKTAPKAKATQPQPSAAKTQQTKKSSKAKVTSEEAKRNLINHNEFQPEPQVKKRKKLVLHLWDYRDVILEGKDGFVTPDTPSLKDVTISSVLSHKIKQPIALRRDLGNRSVSVNEHKGFIGFYQAINTGSKNAPFQFKDVLSDVPTIWNYLGGHWFEEYVYLCLQENKAVESLALQLMINIAGRPREIDVVAYCSGCYYLLSCKSGSPWASDVEELDSLVKFLRQYVGSNYKGILCYARDVNPPENLKGSVISCVSGGALSEILKTKLTKLEPGVAYK